MQGRYIDYNGNSLNTSIYIDTCIHTNMYILKYISVKFQLKKNSDLPKHMCCNCKNNLNDAFNFRENFLKVQALFKAKSKKINKKQTYNNLVEATEFIQVCVYKEEKNVTINKYECLNAEDEEKEINIIDPVDLNRTHCSDQGNKNDVNALELDPTEENIFEDAESVKEKIICDSNLVERSFLKSSNEDNELEDEYKPDSEILTSNIYIRNEKIKKATCPESEIKKSERKGKSKKKLKTTEAHSNIFICDQCGNHFTCRHHFKLHLRRHTGDKRCACE